MVDVYVGVKLFLVNNSSAIFSSIWTTLKLMARASMRDTNTISVDAYYCALGLVSWLVDELCVCACVFSSIFFM